MRPSQAVTAAHAKRKAVILRHVAVWAEVESSRTGLAAYPWLVSRPGVDSHTNAYVRTWGKALELTGAASNYEARGWAPFTSHDGLTTWRFLWRCKDCPLITTAPALTGRHPHQPRSTARQGGTEL